MSLLNYTECEFDTAKLTTARDGFQALHAKIAGRSEGYESITSPVGSEFSDLVDTQLKRLATQNQQAWSSALLACLHAYGVLDKAIEDTDWYEEQIADVKYRLSSAVNAIPSVEQDSYTRVDSVRRTFDAEARTLWTRFEERCQETEDTLKDGPTPFRIRQLAEGGHFGANEQAGYKSSGDVDYYVIDEDYNAELLIVHLYDAVVHGRDGSIDMLESDPLTLALLQSMFRRAEQAREAGGELSERELDFLQDIYQTLGYGYDGKGDGFLKFADQVRDSDHIDDDLRRDIQRVLANSMLVLSDEQVGGGMSRLPEDVRNAADGPEMRDLREISEENSQDYMDDYREWGEKFSSLADLLGHSGGGVRGGTEFSTTLLGTTVQWIGHEQFYGGQPDLEDYQNVVDAATRNPEANNIILTGRDFDGKEYEHHENHTRVSPKNSLTTLYTVDWPDDGEAVRGLTQWLSHEPPLDPSIDPDDLPPGARDLRGVPLGAREDAMVAFLDLLEDDDVFEALNSTNHNVKYKDEDGNEVEWRGVSATQLNPELADGLVDIFLRYSDTFAHTEGVGPGEEVETARNGDTLRFSSDARLAFTQLAVGDPDAAGRLYGEVQMMATEAMYGYVDDTGQEATRAASRSGALTGLVERALLEEAESRKESDEQAVARANKSKNAMLDLGAGALVDAKVPNVVSAALKLVAQDAWTDTANGGASSHVPVRNPTFENQLMDQIALQALIERDPRLLDRIEENFDHVVVGEGADRHIPFDPKDWEDEDGSSILPGVLNHVANHPWPGNGDLTARDARDEFLRTFDNQRGNWADRGAG
ncbi:hypothetical protein [Nocardiopsis sp. NPDC006938]|uniref:TPR repeat region-containing protein n=1 Tax=Nocardiopsis sp. NPDC006938 TaxID=3364337 RepID=UPI0036C23766